MGFTSISFDHLSQIQNRVGNLETTLITNKSKINENPIEDDDICNKKYVDEEIDSLYKNLDEFVTKRHLDDKLKKDQGDESSKIDLSEYAKIKYVDDENKNYLKSKGAKMMSNLDMSGFKISNVLMSMDDTNNVATNKTLEYFARNYFAETMLWEYYVTKADCFYKIDRGSGSELTVKNKNVSKLYDQTLNKSDSTQTIVANQPKLSNSKVNKRRFLTFNGSQRMKSNINLNPQGGAKDLVNVFIIYKIDSFKSSGDITGSLFGHDNGGYDKFVCFNNKHLIVSGTLNNFIVIGDTNTQFRSQNAIAQMKSRANAVELGKWICLSIHWDVHSTPKTNKSSVWCNGQKLTNFTSRSSQGANTMVFGDLNLTGSGNFGLQGSIALFSLYKGFIMNNSDILLHHRVFCNNWYNIETENIPIM